MVRYSPCYYDSMFFIWRSLFSSPSPSPLGCFLKIYNSGLKEKNGWLRPYNIL